MKYIYPVLQNECLKFKVRLKFKEQNNSNNNKTTKKHDGQDIRYNVK